MIYIVTIEDGVETGMVEESVKIIKQPVNEVVLIGTGPKVATSRDFRWVNADIYADSYDVGNFYKGYYKYTGSEKVVKLPSEINGHELTNYYNMFNGSDVEKVISNNNKVNSLNFAFANTTAESIDLSDFDTSGVTSMKKTFYRSKNKSVDLSQLDLSNVTDMSYMFYSSSATSLDLSSFDTSSVTNMHGMFYNSSATSLDLSSFDTSSVTDMGYMFRDSSVTSLDLSSFDTRSVTDMRYMFSNSSASTGYARTQSDANKFNGSSNKPSGLTFTVK